MLNILDRDSDCLHCEDSLCQQNSHPLGIEQLTNNILEAMTDSAWDNLDTNKGTTGDQKSREFLGGMIL